MCANLERLGCDGSDGSFGPDDTPGTADDLTCADTCVELGVEWFPTGCLETAPTCDAVDQCFK